MNSGEFRGHYTKFTLGPGVPRPTPTAASATAREDAAWKVLVVWLEATGRELAAMFERNGITRVATLGEPLDPNLHQAMMEIPSAEAAPGTIVQEIQPGYMIKDRLLRPALVGVAKAG